VRRLAVGFALSADGFLPDYGHSSAVHLNVQDGNGLAYDDRQMQLHGALHLLELACSNILSDGLGGSFHTFCGQLNAGQQFHLLPGGVERHLLTSDGLQAANGGREFGVSDVEFDIHGELSYVTVRAQVIRAQDGDRSHGGQ
jgi:hypothetical protein